MKSPVIIFTHLLVTALTFLTIPPIFANDDEALILSRDNQLFQLNPETIEEISRQPDEHGSKVIAFDAVNQTTWRYGLGILTVTALNGDELFSVEVPLDNNPIEQKLIQYEKRSNQQKNKLKMPYELFRKNSFLIVVPDKQRVFLALGNQLYLYDLQAKLITTVEMKTSVRGMVRDNTRQLIWIANKKHIFKVDDEGVKSPSAFNAIHTRIIDIAYDESLDQLWVAGNGLTRYTMDGKLQSRHRHYYLQRILSDHQGNLWGVNWFSLFRYAVDQDKATQQCKIKRNGRLLDMVVMPSNDGLWAANHSTITQYNSDCEKIQNERYPRNEKPIKALAFLSNDNNPIEIPVIQFISPKQGDIITQSRPTIMMSAQSGSYDINFNSLEVTVNGLSISSTCQNSQQQINCPLANDLPDGENILTTQINDVQGNVSVVTMATFVVEPEIIPDPIITIETPNNSTITNIKELTISGTLNILADVTLNHQASNYTNVFKLPLIDNNKFTTDVVLREGENTFAITATNTAGVSTSQTFKITLDSQSPVSPDVEKITAIIESENTVITGENNSVEAQMLVRIQNSRTSVITNVTANQNGAFLSNINAQLDDELIIVVSDLAGNESPSVTVTVKKPQDPNLPPDPEKEAPPIVKDGSTSVSDATIFIHQGENPIQTGVEPGTIEAKRTVLLRGKVTNTDGSVLSGVTISIHNHEEFGQTKSRADGMFDMVVNGGGYVTVQFNKTGYPPVQRKVLAPWQEYVVLPNVAMLPISTEVSTIDLTQPNVIQVAQNKAVTDKDGTRQGTVLFPPNTTATITLKDGTQKQLNQMNVHITEYTVGDKGVNAMPANLPANTDYTYAIELTTDEVLNEGIKVNGKDVEFNQPIPYYVENFLGFPVGTPVPSGYYDNDKNAWIASENGRVIEIVSIENGKANIDIDGDQQAEDNTTLSTFGINQNEQIKLAGLYQSGQTLWRVPLTHFSTYDFNYGRDCEGNCEPPEEEEPEKEKPEPDPECESGSIIQCENQVLGETIVVNKESWSLRYSSDRVSGRKTEHTLNIILSGNNVPKNVSKISLEIVIAGRKMYKEFDPLPNQKYSFVWDGKDVYGRTLSGAQSVLIRIGHQYKKGFYYLPPNVSKSFGYPSGQLKTSNVKARNPITVWQEYRSNLTFFRNSSFGGWNATMHHTIDVTSQLLLKGDGSKKSLNDYGFKIRKVAGRHGANGYLGNIKKATDAWLNSPTGVAIGGDGSLYIADYFNHRIRKVDTNGNISTIAGSGPIGIGKGGFGGDGGLAINANLFNPTDIDIGPNGGIYIADSRNERIRYVNSDGIISTVAGNGLGSRDAINGENGLAVDAMIYSTMIHVAFDGSLYFSASDSKRTVIRKVSVDGIITTIAGLGEDEENYGDGGLAINAIFTTISDITSDKDGNIYVAENTKIRKISINGIITTIAGSDESGAEGEGGLAINARFMKILTIDIGQDGTIYIIDNGGQIEKITPRIISIRPDGFVFMIAGMGKYSAEEIEGGSVRDVKLLNVGIFGGIAIGKMNDIYYSAGYVVNSIYYRNSENKYSKSSLSDIVIPSKLADELYVFNRYGRHLKTINAVTGSVIYEFYYNDQGLLIGVKDRDNQLTKITRSDNKITITSSKGQKTFLTLNSDGYLESVKNTENETIKLTYYNGGLLKSLKDAKLQIHYYSYDDQGRLKYDENPIGGSWSLTRKVLDDGYQVTKTSKLGRTTIFNIDNSQEKPGLINKIRTTTYPDGSKKEVIRSIISNDKKTINPDGTIIEEKLGYDPIFSVHAPFIKESILTTPNNLIQKTTREKSAKLLDKNDLSSLESLTNNVTINGRLFRSHYVASNRTTILTSPENRLSKITIDKNGRLTQKERTGLASSLYAYNTLGQLETITVGDGNDVRLTQFSYHPEGTLKSITNAENEVTIFPVYDSIGRLKQQELSGSRLISYGYDKNSNLTSITPPEKPLHEFDFTGMNQLKTYFPPEVDDTLPTNTSYQYNKDQQLELIQLPNNTIIDFEYDQTTGQLKTIITPRGSLNYQYRPVTGQLDNITTPDNDSLSFGYDGFLKTSETWSGILNGQVKFTFDNNFRLKNLGVNDDPTITYQYDNDSLLIQAGDLILNRKTENGLLESTELNNISDQWLTSQFGETKSYTVNYNNQEIYKVSYPQRDKLGRIKQKIEIQNGISHDYKYSYDTSGRLETVIKDNVLISTYSYDKNGNREQLITSTSTKNATFDDQDRLKQYGDFKYTYSQNGELKTKKNIQSNAVTQYDYDVFGNLRLVMLPNSTTIKYLVDAKNRRIGKLVNNQFIRGFLYKDNLNPVAQLDKDGNVIATFVYADKINIPSYMIKNGVIYKIISDHLGSPKMVVNTETGNVVQQMEFDEYGQMVLDTNQGFQPFGYAGGIYDYDTKLTRFGARDYLAEIGRWTAKDPIRFDAGTNLFVYTHNDPINYIDSDGLLPKFGGGGKGGKGERKKAGSAGGTPNKWKHYKDHPTDPNKVIFTDPHTGKKIEKQKPNDYPNNQEGFIDPSLFEWFIPWQIIPSEIATHPCEMLGGPNCGSINQDSCGN